MDQKEKRKIRHLKNADRYRERSRKWRLENLERVSITRIAYEYNICPEFAANLFVRSMQSCDCCGAEWVVGSKRLFIDHNYDTGVVRGILCHHCNTSLGLLKEDSAKISALLDYNRKHNG